MNFVLAAIVSIPGAVVFFSKAVVAGGLEELFTPSNIGEMFNFGIIGIILNSAANAVILPLTPIFSGILYYKLKYKGDELQARQ